MIRNTITGLLTLASVANAAVLPKSTPENTNSGAVSRNSTSFSIGACALIARAEESAFAADQNFGDPNYPEFHIDPQIADDCLQSVLLEKKPALEFIQELSKFLQFQTTLAYLASPPAGSGRQPLDILKQLRDISRRVEEGSLTKWYQVEQEITTLLSQANDDHLSIEMPLQNLIKFKKGIALVSLSPDGKQIPKIYQAYLKKDSIDVSSSAITKFNNEDIVTFVEKSMSLGPFQGRDARYNKAFAAMNPYYPGEFWWLLKYPGTNNFTITFENGTIAQHNYSAWATAKPKEKVWSKLKTGQDIWNNYVNVNHTLDPFNREGTTSKPNLKDPVDKSKLVKHKSISNGVPEAAAYVEDNENIFRGYFLGDETGKGSNTAVMNLRSFGPFVPITIAGVREAVSQFLLEAEKRNSEKLIIDLRGNPGGLIALVFDTYKQLFPNGNAVFGSRIRSHPAFLKLVETFTKVFDKDLSVRKELSSSTGNTGKNSSQELYKDEIFWAAEGGLSQFFSLDRTGKPFASFEDFIGPVSNHGDKFTSVLTFAISDLVKLSQNIYKGYTVDGSGYGSLTEYDKKKQIFKPENIVVLTDSRCSSSCNSFVELLRTEQKVRSIVIGGRPTVDEPTKLVGGVRGPQSLQASELYPLVEFAEKTFPFKNSAEKEAWNKVMPHPFHLNIAGAAVNYRDMIRPTDPTQTPLEFVTDPADCKIFFEKDTLVNSHKLWAKVEALAWGNDNSCAWGSLKAGHTVAGNVSIVH
ncbi:hypothetical protein TWF694_005201 [Orbilia ellipsospora]|uniref:Tail specific protease domain-containing protein n=1 Tax=Orbilia ellipsospora TaxID=2528407 RepID=A0AAV9WUV4_9PEZI